METTMGCEVLAIGWESFMWIFQVAVAALVVLAAYLWVIEFAQLMALGEADFPGRNDKSLWVAAFIFTFILGAIAFLVWRKVMLAMRAERNVRR